MQVDVSLCPHSLTKALALDFERVNGLFYQKNTKLNQAIRYTDLLLAEIDSMRTSNDSLQALDDTR